MPTDEQLRERFEDWGRTYYLNLIRTRGGQYQDVLTEAAYAAWRARDAEVQALREALTYALHVLECLKADNPNPLLPNARWRSVDMARAALAGGETGETE